MSKFLKFLLYLLPFVTASYFVLFLYQANINRLFFTDIIQALVFSNVLILISFILISLIVRHTQTTITIATAFAFLFFSYGHVYEPSHEVIQQMLGFDFHWILISIWLLLLFLIVFIVLNRQQQLSKANENIALVFGGLFLYTVGSTVYYNFNHSIDRSLIPAEIPETISITEQPEILPNIYYIILDAYGSNEALQAINGFDNSNFIHALEERGFFVAKESQSNYNYTFLSLASSLNMHYLNFLEKQGTDDRSLVHTLLHENQVSRTFQTIGYEIHFLPGLWYEGANKNKYASQISSHKISVAGLFKFEISEFDDLFIRSTFLSLFTQNWMTTYRQNAVWHQLDTLNQISQNENATFTFAHFLIPHDPYIFTPDDIEETVTNVDGEYLNDGSYPDGLRAYTEQVNFTNRVLIQFVDSLLQDTKNPPIIILQGDHGYRYGGWDRVTNRKTASTFPILNAYYVPQQSQDALYETISPVNSFRIIFNTFFGANLDLLPDKSYFTHLIVDDPKAPFQFTEIDPFDMNPTNS